MLFRSSKLDVGLSHRDREYKDYPTYIQENGLDYAKVRRALYHNRHKKDIDIKGSNGWLSSILLW